MRERLSQLAYEVSKPILKILLFFAIFVFYFVPSWILPCLIYFCIIQPAASIYRRVFSVPMRWLGGATDHVLQWATELYMALAESRGIILASEFAESILWLCFESPMGDSLALAVLGCRDGLSHALNTLVVYMQATVVICALTMPTPILEVAAIILILAIGLPANGTMFFFLVIPQFYGLCSDTVVWQNANELSSKLSDNELAYRPLGPGCIRLLILQPGASGTPVVGTLQYVRLLPEKGAASSVFPPPAPPYEALSYVWGPPALSRRIVLDGRPFAVARNLYGALGCLRKLDSARVLWMWIDGVCINQADAPERGAQVLLMGAVYRCAIRVVVWLGSSAPVGTRCALEYAARSGSSSSSPCHIISVRAISALLISPWWTRIWTVQELVLARAVVLQVGAIACNWDTFRHLAERVCLHPYFRPQETHLDEFRSLLAWCESRQRNEQPKYDLLGLVYAFRARHATNPRDKLFALLPMLDPEGEGESTIRPVPSYEDAFYNKVEIVCREFTKDCVNRFGSLAVVVLVL